MKLYGYGDATVICGEPVLSDIPGIGPTYVNPKLLLLLSLHLTWGRPIATDINSEQALSGLAAADSRDVHFPWGLTDVIEGSRLAATRKVLLKGSAGR